MLGVNTQFGDALITMQEDKLRRNGLNEKRIDITMNNYEASINPQLPVVTLPLGPGPKPAAGLRIETNTTTQTVWQYFK